MEEYSDLFDCQRRSLNRLHRRGAPLPPGAYNIITSIWVLDSDGNILVTKRHPDKHLGGLWECTGGGVMAGENSLAAARRELEEEIGLKVRAQELQLAVTFLLHHYQGIFDVYIVRKDVPLSALTLQPEEVVDAKWITRAEYRTMHENGLLIPGASSLFLLWDQL